jgi:tripartite-type tricarboxylate transporter receptor subunit TctC
MAAVAAAPWVRAQGGRWPERPIRIIVPFAPGGGTDQVARLVATEIARDLGQPVIVDNRPGAAGNLGADMVAKSTPDGYTLLWGTVGTQAINPLVNPKLPYDARKDFQPVAMVASYPNLLVVPLSSPAKGVAELVALGRSRDLSYASSGVGTSLHLSGAMLAVQAGLSMTHAPYKGSSQAMTDVIGGQVDLFFDNMPVAYAMARSGKVRPLAVTGASRFPLLPEVPTMVELGYGNFVTESWNGLLAPAGTPGAVVARLDAAVRRAVTPASFADRLMQAGIERNYKDSAQFAQYIQAEYAQWRSFIEANRISVE